MSNKSSKYLYRTQSRRAEPLYAELRAELLYTEPLHGLPKQ